MSNATDAVDVGHRLPTQHEGACAAQAVTALAQARGGNGHRGNGESARLAPAKADLVINLLGGVASGQTVTLVPSGGMLTTQQAGGIVGVPRPHLRKLLKTGRIPFILVGSHRRIMHADKREIILRLHHAGLFRARWTERILDEWTLNLLEQKPQLEPSVRSRWHAIGSVFRGRDSCWERSVRSGTVLVPKVKGGGSGFRKRLTGAGFIRGTSTDHS